MVTSHGDAQTVRESIAAGCDDYIKKPFTLDLISSKLVKIGLVS